MLQLVKYIETEIRIVVLRIWGEKGIESYCLMGIEFQFCKTKSSRDGYADSFTSLWLYLISLNHWLSFNIII